MKCFYHSQSDAVGICKNCSKGLCKECAIDVGNGIACKDKCENEVRAVNEIIGRSKTGYQKTSQVYLRHAIASVFLAAVFLIFGIIDNIALLKAASVAFFLYAIFEYSAGRKFAKQ